MKLFRRQLTYLAAVIVVTVLLAGVAFIPASQAWIARTLLQRQPGLRVSIGSVMAGFGRADFTDLKLETRGAVLTIPSVEVHLPLITALWHRKFLVRGLAAKGWTLDVGRAPTIPQTGSRNASSSDGDVVAASPAAMGRAPARLAEQALGAFSGSWELPAEVSLTGVDIEGDVRVTAADGGNPATVHLTVTSDGTSTSREGTLVFLATIDDPRFPPGLTAKGDIAAAMGSPRAINSIEVRADLSAADGPIHSGVPISAIGTLARNAGGSTFSLVISRGGRHLAGVATRLSDATRSLAGTWDFDVRDSDLAPFAPDHPLPSLSVRGDGRFDADLSIDRVHADGQVNAVVARLGVLAPSLDRLGSVTLGARFNATRVNAVVRLDQFNASLAGRRPIASLESRQPFDLNEETGAINAADPSGDLMACSVRGLPLGWLPIPIKGLKLAGGDATGEFVLRAANGGFALRAAKPATATDVSVAKDGRTLAQKLDLSLSLAATYDAKGWQLHASPFDISSGGRRLATLEGQASRTGGQDQTTAITAKWSVDLDALATSRSILGAGWIRGRSASGEGTATFGPSVDINGKMVVVGHDAGHTLALSGTADVEDDGSFSFQGPVKIAFGSSMSEMAAEGSWAAGNPGRFDGKLTGESVDLGHLRLLGGPVTANEGGPRAPGARDPSPFWGNLPGSLKLSFEHLRMGSDVYDNVGGTLYLRSGFVQLIGGRWMLPHLNLAHVEGMLSFDGAAELPYTLKADATANEFDAAPLFPEAQQGGGAQIEGHFSVTGAITGRGANEYDLIGRTQEKFLLASKGGVFRLLKTSVAESIPESASHVSDSIADAGSAVGSFFGLKGSPGNSAKNSVSKNADAVIAFTYETSEIAFDAFTCTAIRGSDGAIQIVDLDMTAPDQHLTGSGRIAAAAGLPVLARPLELDLKLGAKGHSAELLAKAALLSTQKDDQGYAMLSESFTFLGSLEKIDVGPWHDLLVAAATRKPVPAK